MNCPACRSAKTRLSEQLRTNEIAEHWARTAMHGAASADEIRQFVREDIGAEYVEMHECLSCGLEFARPARTWRAHHYPHEPHQLGWDHEEALRVLAVRQPVRLLDIGCADGQFLARARALGHEVTGVDFSEEDIAAAREQGFEAYDADLSRDNSLASAGRRFGAITMFQVIEHLENPDLVFEGLGKLAAPDALLMVGCPSSRRYTRRFRHPERLGSSDFWDAPPQHVLRWTPAALEAFFARHGWEGVQTRFEPRMSYHAAAHLAGIRRLAGSPWRKRVATLLYFLRLEAGGSTGIRLFARARRKPAKEAPPRKQ